MPLPLSPAIWMILVAGILPLVAIIPAKLRADYDNRNPRAQYTTLSGRSARAVAAHNNSLEAFPFFAAAVLVALLAGGPRWAVDVLAVAFILLRAGYIWAYWTDRHMLRSILWSLGWFACVALFMSPLAR